MPDQETRSNSNTSDREDIDILDKAIIERYKTLPELWDANHSGYHNKVFRNKALNEILKILKKFSKEETMTIYHARRKINILRSNYRREQKKKQLSKCVSSGREFYTYIPNNWKFHALQFLGTETDINDIDKSPDLSNKINCINYDDSVDALDNEASDETGDETLSSNDEKTTEPISPTEGKITLCNINLLKRPKQETVEYLNVDTDENEFNAIAANVACKLKRMTEDQRCHAELLINKVLLHGLRNNLNYSTDLSHINTH